MFFGLFTYMYMYDVIAASFDRAYEVVLGGDGNTASWLEKHLGDAEVAKVSTPNIVNCNELQYFWVESQNVCKSRFVTLFVVTGHVE